MSRLPIELTPEAEGDILEARIWYRAHAPRVVRRFRLSVRQALKKIGEKPYLYPVIRDDIRRAVVTGFPYSIHFTIEDDFIQVFAVCHQSRDPSIWQRRI